MKVTNLERIMLMTNEVKIGDVVRLKSGGPKMRWKERSKTYQGIADAMAEQWGNL